MTAGISAFTITIIVLNNELLKPKLSKLCIVPMPIQLIAAVGGTLASGYFDLAKNYNVTVVGHIPTGIPGMFFMNKKRFLLTFSMKIDFILKIPLLQHSNHLTWICHGIWSSMVWLLLSSHTRSPFRLRSPLRKAIIMKSISIKSYLHWEQRIYAVHFSHVSHCPPLYRDHKFKCCLVDVHKSHRLSHVRYWFAFFFGLDHFLKFFQRFVKRVDNNWNSISSYSPFCSVFWPVL